MGRLLVTNCQLQIILFVLTCCFTCLTGASLTVEQRLQALEASNVEIKQILVSKSQRLEELENEVQQLRSIVIELQYERNVVKNQVKTVNNQPTGKNAIFRTCRETHLADPSLASGKHWIDPDGQGVGDDPIQVYCDMATGNTAVLHDSESPIDVGHCADPGCYSRTINYNSSMRQMIALADLSSQCQQTIRYDCNYAPFVSNGVTYSWWNDRDGNPQDFSPCQCGIDNNCVESYLSCNCDSSLPLPQHDIGKVTNKNRLPVTKLSFGRTLLETSSGVHTLGRFECSGQVAVDGMPSSCTDLWRIGHTLTGFYSVKGTEMMESVYCDFTKLPSEAGFENRLGYVDIKSYPTFFYVQKTVSFNQTGIPVPFETERVNIGGAMNLTSGIFTAPRIGTYFFTFSGKCDFITSTTNFIGISLVLNGNSIGIGSTDRSGGSYGDSYTISLQSTLELKTGDKVWLQVNNNINNANLYNNLESSTHFTGQMLQENLSQYFH